MRSLGRTGINGPNCPDDLAETVEDQRAQGALLRGHERNPGDEREPGLHVQRGGDRQRREGAKRLLHIFVRRFLGSHRSAIVCGGQLLTAFLEPRTQGFCLVSACCTWRRRFEVQSRKGCFARGEREPGRAFGFSSLFRLSSSFLPYSSCFLLRRRTCAASRGPCKPTGRTPCCSKSTAPWLPRDVLCGLFLVEACRLWQRPVAKSCCFA